MTKNSTVNKPGFFRKIYLDFIIWDFLNTHEGTIGNNLQIVLDGCEIIKELSQYHVDLRRVIDMKEMVYMASFHGYIGYIKMMINTMTKVSDFFVWNEYKGSKPELFNWYVVNSQEYQDHDQMLIEANKQLQIFRDLILQDKEGWLDKGANNTLTYLANDTIVLIKLLSKAIK